MSEPDEDLNLTEHAEHAAEATTMASEIARGAEVIGEGVAGEIAAVAAAGVAGVWVGEQIDHATHLSDKWSDAAVAASNPEDLHAAEVDDENAHEAWARGDHVEAVADEAEAVGHFAEDSAKAAGHWVADEAGAVGRWIEDEI
jgi:hypothetical protein